jgi:pimeloyl-ACP methyl ester carboxylesterase
VTGWAGGSEHVKENARTIVWEGRAVVSVDAPHGVDHSLKAEDRIGKVADAELRRIAAFISGLDAAGIQKVDAIGHSEGALDVLLAAAMFPERFNNIVLVNPGGLIANDDAVRLSLRFAHDMIRSWYFAYKQGTVREKLRIDALSLPNVLKNIPQSAKEVVSIANSHVYELLRQVRESGIGITIIHGPEDVVFPFSKMSTTIQDMKESPEEDITTLLNGVYSVAGDHNTFIRRVPEYTRLAVGALRAMEEQKHG